VFFARWLDVRFAVWCDAVIEDILKGSAELVVTKPAESAVMALPQDYSSALRAPADAHEAKQKLVAEVHVLTPKADVFDRVVADKMTPVHRFARTLPGVNAQRMEHHDTNH
jgi:hypothetical protein